jgi:hypothetical protein
MFASVRMPLTEQDLLTLAEKRALQEHEAGPNQAGRSMRSVHAVPSYASGRPSMSPGGGSGATEGLMMQQSAPLSGEESDGGRAEQSKEKEKKAAGTERSSGCVIA